MSALADYGLSPRGPAARRRLRLGHRAELAALAAGLVLPVPALAATGLSIPLPETVARLAAALVPWADDTVSDEAVFPLGDNGVIVRTRAEAVDAPSMLRTDVPPPLVATTAVVETTTAGAAEGGRKHRPRGSDPGASEGAAGTGETGGLTGGTASGGETPSGSGTSGETGGAGSGSDPVGGLVDQVGSATQPVTDTVDGVLQDPVGTVDETLQDPVGTVGDAVGGLLSGK